MHRQLQGKREGATLPERVCSRSYLSNEDANDGKTSCDHFRI